MTERIGFMQGRLCDLVDGMIQAFPRRDWRLEFSRAQALGLCMMEWTIDQSGLYDNPLMTEAGRREIARLSKTHGLVVPSLTGDCFMQAPFWKETGAERSALQRDFKAVTAASAESGIEIIVVPLVDNGRIETVAQENCLVDFLYEQHEALKAQGVKIVFEVDFGPAEAARFLERLPSDTFGLNYDIGNSAALGFNPAEEFRAYGDRIVNVHVKDRVLNGTTVPLGNGNADFAAVFGLVAGSGYAGNYIMQTARAADGDHAGALARFKGMIERWIGAGDHAA